MGDKAWDLTVPANDRHDYLWPGDVRDVKEHVQISAGFYAEAQSTPDQTIAIYEGVVYFGTTKVEYAGLDIADLGTSGAFEVSALTANYYNKILFTINSSGTLEATEGTEGVNVGAVVAPSIPQNKFPICMVTVQDDGNAGAGTILTIEQSEITQIQSFGKILEMLDEDDMASDSDTKTVSQQSVKAFVAAEKTNTDVIEMNILLNAFRIAINGSLVKFNLVDGIMDEFEDESGVDTGASTNEDYDAADDYYSPATGTSWSDTLDADWGGINNITVRQVIAAASISSSGSKIRVTLEAGATEGLYIDNVAIVERDGSTPNGVTTPTEILFSGGSGVNIAAGEQETSDWLTYALDEAKDYLLIADVSSDIDHDNGKWVISGGDDTYYKTATDSYNTQNLVSPSTAAGYTSLFNKLEVGANMSLQSEATEAEANPDTVRIVLMEEDVDSITINTDIKAYASRDNGANFVQATLVDEGDYGSGKRILTGEADVSGQASDKTMKWKVTTHNSKGLKLHGLGELWN